MSAFSSKGKLRPMQMLVKNLVYVKAMKNIGKEWGVSEDMFSAKVRMSFIRKKAYKCGFIAI